MADPGTGLAADNIDGDLSPASRASTPRRPTSAPTCGAPSSPRDLGLITAHEEAETGSRRRLTTLGGLERHEPSRHVLQLVRPDDRRKLRCRIWPRTAAHGLPVPVQRRQRLAGRRADGRQRPMPALRGPGRRAPGRRWTSASTTTRRQRRRPRPDPRRLLGGPAGRSARCRATTAAARRSTTPATTTALSTPSRGSPRYLGIAPGQIPPRHYFGTCRTFPATLRLVAGRSSSRSGVYRTYLGSGSSRAPTATAACSSCRPGAATCSRR